MLIEQIAALQETNGLFSSYRSNKYWFYRRKDENAFVTASVLFILQELPLTAKEILIFEQIKKKTIANFELFKKTGEPYTYNFYKAGKKEHFNNGLILKHFNRFKLPNDLDDTALIYLVNDSPIEKVKAIQNLVETHANGRKKWIKNTPKAFRLLKAYSTWFGKNMPIEFDFCVMCNALSFFAKQGLTFNETDLASLRFIGQCIKGNYLLKSTLEVSQNYPRFSLCAYHFGRLAQFINGDFLVESKKKMLLDIDLALKSATYNSEIRLLEIAKAKILNQKIVSKFPQASRSVSKPFFIAGFLSGYAQKWIKPLAKLPFFQIEWQSEALDLAIKMEHGVWTEK